MAVRLSRGQHSYQYLFSFCNVALFYCQRKRVTIAFFETQFGIAAFMFYKIFRSDFNNFSRTFAWKKGYFVVPSVIQEHLNFFLHMSLKIVGYKIVFTRDKVYRRSLETTGLYFFENVVWVV